MLTTNNKLLHTVSGANNSFTGGSRPESFAAIIMPAFWRECGEYNTRKGNNPAFPVKVISSRRQRGLISLAGGAFQTPTLEAFYDHQVIRLHPSRMQNPKTTLYRQRFWHLLEGVNHDENHSFCSAPCKEEAVAERQRKPKGQRPSGFANVDHCRGLGAGRIRKNKVTGGTK